MPPRSFFQDNDFQDYLVALLCHDIHVLRQCAHLLHPDDFKPVVVSTFGRARWIVAERALEYYTKYHEPIHKLLKTDLLEYAQNISLGERMVVELLDYYKHLRTIKLNNPDAIADKAIHYKRDKLQAQVVNELVELQSAGQLTNEKWAELSSSLTTPNGHVPVIDYFETLEQRLERRRLRQLERRNPLLLIEPLDALVRCIGPGHFGVVIAPLKRGKSLFLHHIALAYALQNLNVSLVTLEDLASDVEDRLDSAISYIPIHWLISHPRLLKQRFHRFRRLVRSRIKIIDGTEGGMSVAKIEQILLRERDHGFHTDALIVDYDDEITPPRKHRERRFEFADIYRDLRQLAARHHAIVWTGAQTQRHSANVKILSEDYLAEDISKARKCTWALGLGAGDWGEESMFLYVIASRIGPQHIGCNIMSNRSRMLFYDRDLTCQKQREKENEEEDQ